MNLRRFFQLSAVFATAWILTAPAARATWATAESTLQTWSAVADGVGVDGGGNIVRGGHITGTGDTITLWYSIRNIPKRYFRAVRECVEERQKTEDLETEDKEARRCAKHIFLFSSVFCL